MGSVTQKKTESVTVTDVATILPTTVRGDKDFSANGNLFIKINKCYKREKTDIFIIIVLAQSIEIKYKIIWFVSEFNKQVLLKLNKILYKVDRLENSLKTLEEKIQFKDNDPEEEYDIQFPLLSVEDLKKFEEQLQESHLKHKVVIFY